MERLRTGLAWLIIVGGLGILAGEYYYTLTHARVIHFANRASS